MNKGTKYFYQSGLIIMSLLFGNSIQSETRNSIQLDLSGSIFSISTPHHNSKNFPKIVTGTKFNIWDKDIFEHENLFKPVVYVWDYKGSWFQGLRGTLMMAIFIEYKENNTQSKTMNIDNLENYYLNVIHDHYSEHNENAMKINQPERVIALPNGFTSYTSTAGLHWLTYRLEGSANRKEFITPLGEKHIIRISFELMPTGTGRETGWLEEVETEIDNIMRTTRLQ